VMLSGETAKGSYPLEAVRMMANCCLEAESAGCYRQVHADQLAGLHSPVETAISVAASAVMASTSAETAAIICLSVGGTTARLISKFRPRCPVFVVSRDMMTCRLTHLHRGSYPFPYLAERVEPWEADVAARLSYAMKKGVAEGFLKPGDTVIAVHGNCKGAAKTNTVRSLIVG